VLVGNKLVHQQDEAAYLITYPRRDLYLFIEDQ